jgi:hypothetical protein
VASDAVAKDIRKQVNEIDNGKSINDQVLNELELIQRNQFVSPISCNFETTRNTEIVDVSMNFLALNTNF